MDKFRVAKLDKNNTGEFHQQIFVCLHSHINNYFPVIRSWKIITEIFATSVFCIWNCWKLLFVQSGTYVKNDIAEVSIFSHHVEGFQRICLMQFVDVLQRGYRLLLVFGNHLWDISIAQRGMVMTWNNKS